MPQQIKRLLLVFGVLIACFIGIRTLLVPASFGKYGHYRADSTDDIRKIEPKYAAAGVTACEPCHPDIVKVKSRSRHAPLACQTCHGPALSHTGDPMSVKPDKPRGREFCALCHSKNTARPHDMPQVDIEEHNPGMDCLSCHKAHDPKIK